MGKSESVRANRMGCNSNSERNHARSFFEASTVRTSIRGLSPVAKNSITSSDMAPTEDIRAKFGRFRILVVGRANAGKTTLLQRVCNTTENPEIFDREGKKVNLTSVRHQTHLPINRDQIDATVVQGSVNVWTQAFERLI